MNEHVSDNFVDYDERHAIINRQGATLNGHPASIMGALKDFALITDRTTGLSAQWAWSSVQFVMTEREGKFRT